MPHHLILIAKLYVAGLAINLVFVPLVWRKTKKNMNTNEMHDCPECLAGCTQNELDQHLGLCTDCYADVKLMEALEPVGMDE